MPNDECRVKDETTGNTEDAENYLLFVIVYWLFTICKNADALH